MIIKFLKQMIAFVLFLGIGIYLYKTVPYAFTEPLTTNSGIQYPISLATGIDAKGKNVFADDDFLSYIRQEKFATGKYSGYSFDLDEDGFLSREECETVRVLSLPGRTDIESLQGIEAFPKLRELYCNGSGIRSLDLTNNPRLQILACSNTPLTDLNVSNCSLLRELKISGCALTSLQLADNSALQFLTCQNQIREAGEYKESGRYLVQLTDLDRGIDLNRVSDVKIDGVTGDSIHSGYDGRTGLIYCSDEMKQISYVYTFEYGGVTTESVDRELQVTLNLTTGIREAYDSNGGSRVLPQFFKQGEKDQEPETPKRDGYQFIGWHTDASQKNLYHFGNILVDNKVLYAGWEKKAYKIIYESENSNLSRWEHKNTVDWWTTNLIPTQQEAPIRSGYTLAGWKTETGLIITEENAAKISYGEISGNSDAEQTVLQAIWKANTGYRLNIDIAVSDSLKTQIENMPYLDNKTLFSWDDNNLLSGINSPSLAGHQFTGWYTARTGGTRITQNMTYQKLYEAQFASIKEGQVPTIYGRFSPTIYTIFYNECGGSKVADKHNVLWGSADLLPKKKPKKKGYIFAGWKLDGKKVTKKTKLDKQQYAYVDSVTLKAVWYKKYEPKGKAFRRYGYIYKVTKSNKKGNRVKLIKVKKSKIVIRNKIFLNGKFFKVTSIQKKALKGVKKIRISVPRKYKSKYRRMVKKAGGKLS